MSLAAANEKGADGAGIDRAIGAPTTTPLLRPVVRKASILAIPRLPRNALASSVVDGAVFDAMHQ
jgi:hypothetical protein